MPISPTAVGASLGSVRSTWTPDDVILYHLALGAGVPATDAGELQYTYEADLKVLPTFSVNLGADLLLQLASVDGIDFPLHALLHGEQDLQVHAPLPTRGEVTSTGRISEIWDKGSGAVVVLEVETIGADGELLVTNRFRCFIRGEGGFGGESGPRTEDRTPDRDPDLVVVRSTMPQQALLYRLCGDKNPMHADPAIAALGGFDRPLLHGLCTYGIVAKAVVDELLDGDVTRVANYSTRFSKPVFPGDDISVSMWREDGLIAVSAGVPERDATVLTNTILTVAS